MKSTEIHVGTDYAFAAYLPRRDSHDLVGTDRVDRARVVSAPNHGEVEAKIYYGTAKRAAHTRTVPVRNLLATWERHLERLTEKADHQAEQIATLKASAKTIKSILGKKRFKDLPYGFDGQIEADGSYATGGKMRIDVLAELLQAAYDRGVDDTIDLP